MRLVLAVLASALLLALPVRAENWADETDPITTGPEYARSKAICRGLKRVPLPSAAGLDDAAVASLKGCRSEDLYYGIGRPADPARARQCALLERQTVQDSSNLFSGDTMLMTIYANGVGAARNLDLAIALACQIGGAPAEQDGRVTHFAKLKAEHWTGTDFSFCDDVTSGLAAGYCAAHEARIADARRQQSFASLTARWSEADRRAFAALQKAEKVFADTRADNEVDMSGTARAAMSIDEKQGQDDDFLGMLRSLAENKAPTFTPQQLEAADAKLNAVYRQVQQRADPSPWGTVTKDGIRSTQRAWLRYRDAWTAFVAAKHPVLADREANGHAPGFPSRAGPLTDRRNAGPGTESRAAPHPTHAAASRNLADGLP